MGTPHPTIDVVRAVGLTKGFKLISEEYQNRETHMLWECSAGHRTWKTFSGIKMNHRCLKCVGLQKLTLEEVRAGGIERGFTLLSTEYVKAGDKLLWLCSGGHQIEQRWSSVREGHRCRMCVDKARTFDATHWQALAEKFGGRFVGGLINSQKYADWECALGHPFRKIPNTVQQGGWCPTCGKKMTKGENEMYTFCLGLVPEAKQNVLKLLPSPLLELDVWIPSTRKAIELNGSYWHSRPDHVERDKRKVAECKKTGIDLLVLDFTTQWYRKTRPIGEALIRRHLGVD